MGRDARQGEIGLVIGDEYLAIHDFAIEARFLVPAGGGRATDPRWTERRLVPLAPRTLERLEAMTAKVRKQEGVNVEPMQLAALLLEKTTGDLIVDEVPEFVRPKRRARR